MLSRTIADSKKLSEVSERAALVYLLLLPQHDGEGLIEADALSLLVAAGRFAISHGWTQDDLEAVRAELVKAELWVLKDGPHGEAAEYANWQNHQRLDKIGRGSSIAPDSDETPGNYGKTSADYGETPALKGREGKGSRREGEVEAPAAFHVDDELPRIRRSFARAFEQVTKSPFTIKPADLETFRLAAQLGTCRPWPDDTDLLAEIVRTLEGMQRRGVRYSVRTAINHLGESWDEPPAQRQNGKDPFPEVVYEDFTGRGQRGAVDAAD